MDARIPMEQAGGPPTLDLDTLPLFQQYKKENSSWISDFDTWSYLNLRADFDLAAAFTKLFWPDFVEVDGCIILKHNYTPGSFQEWLDRFNGDRRGVESMLNHVHVWDLFLNSPKEEYPEQLYSYLANALVFGWRQALRATYPDKRFVFTLSHGYGPEISFCQED